uniref:Uncharacterized protein n=1 Tax=Heterorhabditis bacteriophora TaxID=37862 RepID=A0A1I7WCA1_HETBA
MKNIERRKHIDEDAVFCKLRMCCAFHIYHDFGFIHYAIFNRRRSEGDVTAANFSPLNYTFITEKEFNLGILKNSTSKIYAGFKYILGIYFRYLVF